MTSRFQIRSGWYFAAAALAFVLAGCHKPAASDDAADKKPDEVTVEMAEVTTGPMQVTVPAMGTLAAPQGRSARVASPIAGRIATVNVREGDHVTAGQIVAVIDNRVQAAQARSAAVAASAARSQAEEANLAYRAASSDQSNSVRVARLGLVAADVDRRTAITQAQTSLQAAETDLARTRAGARPQEIAQADQTVQQAQATRDRAATEQDRVQFLFSKGVDSQRQLDDAKTALQVADSALASAQAQAALVKAGARKEDLKAAEIRRQQAAEALDQARATGDAKVAQAQAALRQAEDGSKQVAVKAEDARVQLQAAVQKQADAAAATATADYAEVRAPLSGAVSHRALNPGDMADTTNPIIEIAAPGALDLVATMPTSSGLQIRPGMEAHVTTSDLPGRTFAGRVLSVGQVDPQTNLLSVRIAVNNPGGTLRAGGFASADIVVRTDPHAVIVPKQAVITQEGKSVIYVVGSDSVAHRTDVTLGPEQGDKIEIASGVKAGAKVVSVGQFELTDGTKVKEAGKEAAGDAGGDAKKEAPGS
jgi:RND family efflux transporter MFP subunit